MPLARSIARGKQASTLSSRTTKTSLQIQVTILLSSLLGSFQSTVLARLQTVRAIFQSSSSPLSLRLFKNSPHSQTYLLSCWLVTLNSKIGMPIAKLYTLSVPNLTGSWTQIHWKISSLSGTRQKWTILSRHLSPRCILLNLQSIPTPSRTTGWSIVILFTMKPNSTLTKVSMLSSASSLTV